MTENTQEVQGADTKQNDKEHNLAQMRQVIERERQAREQAERRAAEYEKRIAEAEKAAQRTRHVEEDDDDDEPYVDKKRLAKQLNRFEEKMEQKIDQRAEEKARRMLETDKQQVWLKNNPDFHDVMQHAQKLQDTDPELAETILNMPEGFERQKLVYRNIKMMGFHKPPEQKSTIQEKIDQNRRAPFYQPSGVASAPYASGWDDSPAGQKSGYEKMKELQRRLRL